MKPNTPLNIRSRATGKLELRKLWNVPGAKYIYALYQEYEQQTCEMEGTGKHKVPNWDKITNTEFIWNTQQGFLGDEEWGKATAEHFDIEFPENEYKAD